MGIFIDFLKIFMKNFKRFFEPISETKHIYFLGFIFILIQGFNLVAHIFFIQILTSSLENANQEFFWKIIFAYIAYILIYEIFYFITIKHTWPIFYNQSILNIQGKYFKKFIQLNNNTTETIGTGKLISIMK